MFIKCARGMDVIENQPSTKTKYSPPTNNSQTHQYCDQSVIHTPNQLKEVKGQRSQMTKWMEKMFMCLQRSETTGKRDKTRKMQKGKER